jgi:4-amino-4-deoxy-L-arabinose transferase-like glycosyltransferase
MTAGAGEQAVAGSSPPALGSSAAFSLPGRDALLIVLLGLALLLPFLGPSRTLTRHEVLAAQPAREMLDGAPFAVQSFAGEIRTAKPPAIAWLIAASTTLLQSRAEWVVRLPAALSGVAIAVVVAMLAARFLGRRHALAAGLMQLTFFYVQMQARLAEADMPMALATTLAMAVFMLVAIDSPRGRLVAWWTGPAFWSAVAASALLKGVGPVFVLPACLAFVLITGDRAARRLLLDPLGLLALAAIVGGFVLAAWWTYPGILAAWKDETLGRMAGEMDSSEPILSYLWNVPMLLLPWVPLVAVGAAWTWRHRRGLGTLPLFVLLWVAVGLVPLQLSAFKHKHYAIPLLPPLTLAASVGFSLWLRSRQRRRRDDGERWWLGAAIAAAALAVVAVVVAMKVSKGGDGIALVLGVIAAGVVAMAFFDHARRWRAWVATLFAMTFVSLLLVHATVLPEHDGYQIYRRLAERANEQVPAGETVWLVGLREAQVAWYVDRPLRRADDRERFVAMPPPDADGTYWLLTRAGWTRDLEPLGEVSVLEEADALRRRQREQDRLVLVRVTRE